jgi:uridine kinase
MTSKRIVIIAGPNGAGKTTFAREFGKDRKVDLQAGLGPVGVGEVP